MQTLETYQRKAFLRDHPPVSVKVELTSQTEEQTLLAGTVLGKTEIATGIYKAAEKEEPIGVLMEDVTIPVTGNAVASMYIHADMVQENIIFDESVSADNQKAAITALRGKGIYIY